MKGKPTHLHEIVRGLAPTSDEVDENGLPSPDDTEYEPFGRAANKPLVSLHFITPDGKVQSFQYRHLDSDSRFEHGKIILRFLGYRPSMVVIEGQHLWQLYDYIHQDRTPWIMQASRNFPEKGKPFVSKLSFIDLVETKDSQA
jgi:hypothetical protein